MPKNKNIEAGFGALEIILIVALVTVIGVVGYQAWQNSQTKTTHQTSSKSTSPTPTTPASPAVKYFTIKEWGVKAPLSGTDQLSYTISGNLATIISGELAAKNAGCSTYGAGQIRRLSPTDGVQATGTGAAAADYAKQNPGSLTYVGGYYYMYVHDQAACSTDQSIDAQNQANVATQSLVAHLQASN